MLERLIATVLLAQVLQLKLLDPRDQLLQALLVLALVLQNVLEHLSSGHSLTLLGCGHGALLVLLLYDLTCTTAFAHHHIIRGLQLLVRLRLIVVQPLISLLVHHFLEARRPVIGINRQHLTAVLHGLGRTQ